MEELVDRGEVERRDAERIVQELVDRGRETSERIAANVQREVAKQVALVSERFDELEQRLEALDRDARRAGARCRQRGQEVSGEERCVGGRA